MLRKTLGPQNKKWAKDTNRCSSEEIQVTKCEKKKVNLASCQRKQNTIFPYKSSRGLFCICFVSNDYTLYYKGTRKDIFSMLMNL